MQLRRERFSEELESYAKQVEEFKTYGEMSEIPKYLKKAQTLDNKLQTAAEKVTVFLPFDHKDYDYEQNQLFLYDLINISARYAA
jgi:hypothetical protein